MDDNESLTENYLFNQPYIKFLQDNFMPYIFIWAGFVFRGLETKDRFGKTLTHVTQGSIEKYFGTTKIANGHTGLYPAEYATISANSVIRQSKVAAQSAHLLNKINLSNFISS